MENEGSQSFHGGIAVSNSLLQSLLNYPRVLLLYKSSTDLKIDTQYCSSVAGQEEATTNGAGSVDCSMELSRLSPTAATATAASQNVFEMAVLIEGDHRQQLTKTADSSVGGVAALLLS